MLQQLHLCQRITVFENGDIGKEEEIGGLSKWRLVRQGEGGGEGGGEGDR